MIANIATTPVAGHYNVLVVELDNVDVISWLREHPSSSADAIFVMEPTSSTAPSLYQLKDQLVRIAKQDCKFYLGDCVCNLFEKWLADTVAVSVCNGRSS